MHSSTSALCYENDKAITLHSVTLVYSFVASGNVYAIVFPNISFKSDTVYAIWQLKLRNLGCGCKKSL